MSARGMLMSATTAPQRGEIVEVVLGGQVVVGQVRWALGRNFGIGLNERLNVPGVLQGKGGPVIASRAPAAQTSEAGKMDLSDYGLFVLAGLTSLVFLVYALKTWVFTST